MTKNSSFITYHSSLSLKAPAKINWFLKVLGLRDDGFHEIQSLIQKIALYDILTFNPAKDLALTTNSFIPTEQNLVYKTALLVKEKCGVKSGAHIHLEKHVPTSAGLGGGSSDAAATLIGLNKLWALNLSLKELHAFAQQLGSDVPVFLNGPLAIVEGRGEKITAIKIIEQFDILLVKPQVAVSTAWAYGELKNSCKLQVASHKLKNIKNSSLITHHSSLSSLRELTKKAEKVDNIKFFISILEKAKLSKAERKRGEIINILSPKDILFHINGSFSNDLEAVTAKRFPVIADIKNRLLEEGAMFSMMSGSGPTVFGVFGSKREASKAAVAFKNFWTAVVKTISE